MQTERGHRFLSFKTTRPIHYAHRWIRPALIALTLEPRVEALAPVSSDIEAAFPDAKSVFAAFVNGQRSIHVVLDDWQQIDAQSSDMRIVVVRRSELLLHAARRIVDDIWSRRNDRVAPEFRFRILGVLQSQAQGIHMAELIGSAGNGDAAVVSAIYTMAARGDLMIDLASGLGPLTIVRATNQRRAPADHNYESLQNSEQQRRLEMTQPK